MELMVDIETLSTHPDATVLSIGAVAFSLATGVVPVAFQAVLDRKQQANRRIDADTVSWWIRQAEENPAAATVFHARGEPVQEALLRFDEYLTHWCDQDSGIWANGPDFDLVILRSLYEASEIPLPWTHRQHRCVRTLKQLIEASDIEVKIEPNACWHNAASDADYQARYVMEAAKQLGVTL